jgi:arylsulfatase A-like enzyme
MEGVLVAAGPPFPPGAVPAQASLLDIAPTILHLLGVPVPEDVDGRVLSEILDPAFSPAHAEPAAAPGSGSEVPVPSAYTEQEDAEIQQRLADLGYL